jgi:hypothetical protein
MHAPNMHAQVVERLLLAWRRQTVPASRRFLRTDGCCDSLACLLARGCGRVVQWLHCKASLSSCLLALLTCLLDWLQLQAGTAIDERVEHTAIEEREEETEERREESLDRGEGRGVEEIEESLRQPPNTAQATGDRRFLRLALPRPRRTCASACRLSLVPTCCLGHILDYVW